MTKNTRSIFILLTLVLLLAGCGTPATTPAPSPEPTQPLDVKVDTSATGPQIVAHTPMDGERLAVEGSITVVFDREMDKEKTEKAWSLFDSVGKPINGTVTWKDARTLIFQPTTKLRPSGTYTGALGVIAVAKDGTSPTQVTKLIFKTVDALAVGQVFPADQTLSVAVDSNITVIFNRPVVPLNIKEEQSGLPQPLAFSPEVKGQGEWLNSSVYIFQPEESLDSGVKYEVSVPAGLTDTTGNALTTDYGWSFTTQAPEIGLVSLLNSKNGFTEPSASELNMSPLDQGFIVNFMQPMDTASVARALTVKNRETGQLFPTKLTWNDDLTQLTIQPVGRYTIASFYALNITARARSKSGAELRTYYYLEFATIPLPSIEQVYPSEKNKTTTFEPSMYIDFASPMNFNSLKGKIKFTPSLEKEPELYYDESSRRLYVNSLSSNTDYVVRIAPGMADIYGNTIKSEYSFSFKTGKIPPQAYMVVPYFPLTYRQKGAQEFFFDHTNITSASFSLYSISAEDFSTRALTSENSNAPKGTLIREWEPGLLLGDGKSIRERIKLEDASGNPLPPGYYYIGLKAAPIKYTSTFLQGAIFAVATDNITLKTTASEALAWVVDLEKGLPTANVPVVIYNSDHKEIGRANTDEKGLVSLQGLKDPYLAELAGDGHVAAASNNWGSGVSPYDFGIWDSYYTNSTTQPFGYIYTDRPLYRPGQEVFFKGIVRLNDDLRYTLPTDPKVRVTIDQDGEKIYEQELELSKLGTFASTLKLADTVTLGTYNISVRTSKNEEVPFAAGTFRVAEYHKPEFQVSASVNPTSVLVGDDTQITLDASYYSGGSVSNAKVDWFTQAFPYFFQPSEKYNGFSFMDWDRDTSWGMPTPNGNGIINQGSNNTDEKGHLELTEIASLGQSTTSQQVTFYGNVTDVGGNLVSGNASFVVHQSLVYAGIRSKVYVATEGEEQSFDVAALDWDSKPVAGQTLTVDFVKREWLSVQEQDDQGQLRWVSSVKETPVKSNVTVTTDADGLAKVAFTPPTGGTYKALVTVKDAKGHTHQASTYIWVASSDYVPWRQTNDRRFNLIVDKDSYKPGDTAEIMIAQPFQNDVYALITLERGHIYKNEVVLLKSNSTIYKLPITKEMAPASYVSVTVISGAQDSRAPDFQIGMTRINVDTSEQSLDVSVTADKKAASPNSDVTYTVLTKDKTGKPVPAEISLAVVDKAALALAPANTEPLLKSFYAEQGLAVMTSVGIVLNAEDFNANYEESVTDGQGAGGGGGKGEGDLGIITVRQNFKDTAYYTAQVMTDENGEAKVTVTLPENLTTWQVDVRGVTADTLVGQATGEIVSTKMLFIEMQTPRFFVAGDAAQVGAVVHNNSDAPITVSVSLDAQGADLKSAAEQTLEVPARQQGYVTWDVVVRDGIRRVDFTAHASSGSLTDSSKPALGTLPNQGIPVYTYEVAETVGTSGLLTDANSVTEAVQLPQTVGSGTSNLSVEVSPSLAASMKDGLTFLQDFEYLCVEQTVSRFLPNVVSSRALKLAGGPTLTLQKDLDSNVSAALQRLYAKQLGDGGWSWWDASVSDPNVSAYVMLGLKEAQESGYTISDSVMTRGLEYLQSNQIVVGKNDPVWQHNRQAFLLYVLTRYGEKPQTGLLFENRSALSLYGKAYLAQAIYNIDKKDKRLDTLLSDLESKAMQSAAGAHWEEEGETDYWNWNTNLRTTAIVLDTFIKIESNNEITANGVRWLMSNRTSNHWGSTQDTTWTLIALTDWLVASKEYETSYPFAIGLNGNKLQDGFANKDTLTETTKLNVGVKDLLRDQVNYLVLTRGTGTGNLYYTAYLTSTVAVEDVQPLDQGMVVSRQYFNPDDPKKPITEVKRGDLVRVRLTLVLPNDAHYIVLDDPLPAGLEALDESVLTDMQAPTAYTRQDFDERGWGWWYFTHKEVHDEKVTLSTDFLPAGTYVYTYLARASTIGTFKVIPPHAAEFYFPDVGGRGAGGIFTVK